MLNLVYLGPLYTMVLSKRRFPMGDFPNVQFAKWQLPKCAISQAATSQSLG